MLGIKDILWATLVCLVLSLAIYYRPLWGARTFVEREAEDGFYIAYDGYRFISGQPIVSPRKSGTQHDPMRAAVLRRRFEIKAERMSWNGKQAEFVVRQLVRLEDGSAEGADASQDIHLRLARDGGTWQYTFFRPRDQPAVEAPNADNPFAAAARRAMGRVGAPGQHDG